MKKLYRQVGYPGPKKLVPRRQKLPFRVFFHSKLENTMHCVQSYPFFFTIAKRRTNGRSMY